MDWGLLLLLMYCCYVSSDLSFSIDFTYDNRIVKVLRDGSPEFPSKLIDLCTKIRSSFECRGRD